MGRTLDAWREIASNEGYSGEKPTSTVEAINATVSALGGEGTAQGIAEAVTNLAPFVGGGGGGGGESLAAGLVYMEIKASCNYVVATDADLQHCYSASTVSINEGNSQEGSVARGVYIAIHDNGENVVCKIAGPSGETPIVKTKRVQSYDGEDTYYDVWQVPVDIDRDTESFVVTVG